MPAVASTPAPPVEFPQKDPSVAAALSFFWTGLGQIYNWQLGKGLLFIILQGVNVVLMLQQMADSERASVSLVTESLKE